MEISKVLPFAIDENVKRIKYFLLKKIIEELHEFYGKNVTWNVKYEWMNNTKGDGKKAWKKVKVNAQNKKNLDNVFVGFNT